MRKFFILILAPVLFLIPHYVFAIEIPILSAIILENSSGKICSGNSIGCSSSEDYKINKYDEDTFYVCPGSALSCSSLNDVYRIEKDDDTTYICSGDSFGCSSFNDLYKLEQYDEDTTYICSGDSFGCSSFSDLYKIEKQDDDTKYICSGDSFGCSSFSDLYKVEKYNDNTTYICSGDSFGCSSLSNLYAFKKETSSSNYGTSPYTDEIAKLEEQIKNTESEIENSQVTCPANSTILNNQCYCNDGYVVSDNQCITHTENCKNYYGEYTYGTKGENGGSSCFCSTGYQWNSTKTACVKIITPDNYSSQNTINEEKNLLTKIDKNLSSRLKGKILLQVEKNGEGWYINPDNQKKYFLGRPADAFSIMRNLGLGIKHSELQTYLNSTFPSRLSGKIMLDVEQNGEAYYINPNDLKGYYLNRPTDAFRVMRELGLGITNSDIRKIDIGEIK